MKLHISVLALGAVALSNAPSHAGAQESSPQFQPVGERIALSVPAELQLAFIQGSEDGEYFAEYIEPGQDIQSWKGLYFIVRRYSFPDKALADEAKKHKTSIPDVAVGIGLKQSRAGCAGEFRPMAAKQGNQDGHETAFSGYFCSTYGGPAPDGEGRLYRYILGQDHLHEIAFGWRPRSSNEASTWPPYGISPDMANRLLRILMSMKVCGGKSSPACDTRTAAAQAAELDLGKSKSNPLVYPDAKNRSAAEKQARSWIQKAYPGSKIDRSFSGYEIGGGKVLRTYHVYPRNGSPTLIYLDVTGLK
ncbi:hypothetical protein [Luteimonas sp. e5]